MIMAKVHDNPLALCQRPLRFASVAGRKRRISARHVDCMMQTKARNKIGAVAPPTPSIEKGYSMWSRNFLKTFGLAAGLIIGSVATVEAAPILIYNTGVNAAGTPQANGSPELHYSLLSVPSGTTAVRVATSANGFPIPPWIGDDSVSAWIGPASDSVLDGPTGTYDYRLTFDLTGFIPSTASLAGSTASDNSLLDIHLNGGSTGNTDPGFTAFTPFSISSGFTAGINTLDFLVSNGGGPTGLRVEFSSATASPAVSGVPEPATLALVGAGLSGLGAIRRRRKQRS